MKAPLARGAASSVPPPLASSMGSTRACHSWRRWPASSSPPVRSSFLPSPGWIRPGAPSKWRRRRAACGVLSSHSYHARNHAGSPFVL